MAKKAKTTSRKAAPVRAKKGAKATSKAAAKKASAASQIYVCPNTQQNIYIGRATLQDLKSASTYANSNKKRLWMISSPQTRNELYLDAAEAIANYEQTLLPSFGGRSWEVTCRLTEPQWSGQVLFRAFKGKMELAALPHLIEKIPDPPVWAGKKSRPDEYVVEVGVRVDNATMGSAAIQGLQQREISSLSQAAWDMKEKYPVPTVAVKWVTPERKIFNSRKAAWEHAAEMAEREVQINKIMRGVGSSGKLLSPFFPSAATALKVGKLRFERDGLWVVGQEFNWQENRPEELEEEQILEEERRQSIVPKSGLALFLQKKRVEYRNEHEDCSTFRDAEVELRKIWKALPKEEQMKWNNQVRKERGEPEKKVKPATEKKAKPKKKAVKEVAPEPVLSMTPKEFFVKSSRHEYREERKAQGWPISLSEADIWLRDKWKNHMSPEMREEWKQKIIAHDKAVEEEEKLNQPADEEAPKQSNVKDIENVESIQFADEKKEASEAEPSTEPSTEAVTATNPSGHVVPTKENESSTTPLGKVESKKSSEMDHGEVPVEPEPVPMALVEEEKKEEDHWTPAPAPSTDEPPKADEALSLETEKKVVALTPKRVFKKVEVPKASRVRWCMNQEQMDLCFSACMEHFDTVMRTVKARDLHRELEDGFDVLRERGHGRFDMELPAFDTKDFDFLTDPAKSPWMPIVKTILGDDAVLIHKGSFLSLPGAASQEYHQDGVHLTTQTQRPCHAINVFIPLIDMSMRNGPTEFCLGTHVLGLEGYDRDFLETPLPMAGQPVIFDYRLGHRGLGNTSQICRPIVYCTYARGASDHGMKEFRDSVNFSRKRYHRIGEMSSKPVSREERRENRKRSMEAREEALLQKALEDSTELAASPSSGGDKKPKVEGDAQADTTGKEDCNAVAETKPETEATEKPKTDETEAS
eukprot:Nitzschia sp. Nitz4//scaffold16_size188269//253//3033//NITZ4_001759-RA/size188269-processed-gene-0.0-mRNA-1//1//CDS//3329538419//8762//frame0